MLPGGKAPHVFLAGPTDPYPCAESLVHLINQLVEMADHALTLQPFSVMDKLEAPPSGMVCAFVHA